MKEKQQMMTRGYISHVKKQNVNVRAGKDFPTDGLRELFESNGMETGTPLETLIRAFNASSHLAYAVSDNKIIAIARSMDDGCWNANVDCVCVHKSYQRSGIGTKVLTALLEQLKDVPCITVSPNDMAAQEFYRKLGFKIVRDGGLLQKETKRKG